LPETLTINVSETLTLLEAAKVRKFDNGFLPGETISRDSIAGQTKTGKLLKPALGRTAGA
jgi:hypothetical protein